MPKQVIQPANSPVGSDDSPYGHDVSWNAKPAFMYVHYLRGEYDPVKVYLFQVAKPEIGISQDDISRAISAIQNHTAFPIPKRDNVIEWRVLSYMVFVLDDTSEEFKEPCVKFQYGQGKKNYTFFEPYKYDDGESCCSVFYCTNFRMKTNGKPLDNSSEPYTWVAVHTGRAKRSNKSHTDSGQNTGP